MMRIAITKYTQMKTKINIGDTIETLVGGPYKVLSVADGLITVKMKNGIGMTIAEHVTNIIPSNNSDDNVCEYSGLPSVKSYEK